MSSVFERLLTSLRGVSGHPSTIRRLLAQCESSRAAVELTRITRKSGGRHPRIAISVVKVREEDFIILGASAHQFAPNEVVEVRISRPTGVTVLRSRVLGTHPVEGNAGERQSTGHRLLMPSRMDEVNNRRNFRVRHAPLEVTLSPSHGGESIRATLRDLSVGGACIEVDSSAEILAGARFVLMGQLPSPGGMLAEPVKVVRVISTRSGRSTLGLAFATKATSLLPYLRHVESKRRKQSKRK